MEAQFCQFCGTKLENKICDVCTPPIQTVKAPWYFSKRTKLISFILFTPLWAVLVLANKRTGKGEKLFAGAMLGITILCYAAIYTNTTHAPGIVKFGTRVESLSVLDPGTSFRSDEAIKWATELRSPIGTTSLLLTLSEKQADGVEVPVGQRMLSVASPDFDRISANLDLDAFTIRTVKPGLYVLRILASGKVIASGEFTIV